MALDNYFKLEILNGILIKVFLGFIIRLNVVLCCVRVCEGEDYNLSVEFDSSPAPAILEWVVRSNDRRSQVSLREGERRRGYSVAKYYSVRDERYPDRYKADITFERLQALDMDANAQHTLKVCCM